MDATLAAVGVARVYRMRWWRRGFPVIFLTFSLMMAGGAALKWIEGKTHVNPIDPVVLLVFLAIGSLLVMNSFSEAVVLAADAIELRRLTSTRRLPYSKIRGRREFVVRGRAGDTRYLKIESSDSEFPALEFEKAFNFDDLFWAWFDGLPNLDAPERQQD